MLGYSQVPENVEWVNSNDLQRTRFRLIRKIMSGIIGMIQ